MAVSGFGKNETNEPKGRRKPVKCPSPWRKFHGDSPSAPKAYGKDPKTTRETRLLSECAGSLDDGAYASFAGCVGFMPIRRRLVMVKTQVFACTDKFRCIIGINALRLYRTIKLLQCAVGF